jgi:REP element-mobilizing transposase RayT
MPNHIHLVAKPESDHDFTNINRDFKKYTSQMIIFNLKENRRTLLEKLTVNKIDRKIQIWKRNTHIKQVFNSDFMKQKVEYIHNNPCQPNWELSARPEEYKYSSASFYINDKKHDYFDLFDLRKIM